VINYTFNIKHNSLRPSECSAQHSGN